MRRMNALSEHLKGQAAAAFSGKGIILGLVLSLSASAALGLFLVWLNTEGTRLAYKVRDYQRAVESSFEINAKLKVEHSFRMSPQELAKKAADLGLRAPRPGEIRRMSGSPSSPSVPAQE